VEEIIVIIDKNDLTVRIQGDICEEIYDNTLICKIPCG
jgi:hypothetical protein